MGKIDGYARTVRQLLDGAKYAIDYYQREYKWQTKHVSELVDDLTNKFLEDYQPTHERNQVEGYGHYFLGSIIISDKNGKKFIIDGQQRLTTLTLLLIYLNIRQRGRSGAVKIDDLVYSEKYGKRSFNLDVEERMACMEALFNQQPFDETDKPESIRNIIARYRDIELRFPQEIDDLALPYFVDWLIESVHLIEITAYSDDDAYAIFETMNDRGLSLSPADMLKGYLLANIADEDKRLKANDVWKKHVGVLQGLGKEEDADALKTWLRSQYSQTTRERKKGAQPGDFDRLGTEFHRWVRENQELIGLKRSGDFLQFIQRDFVFYTGQYFKLRARSLLLEPGFETVFYIAQHEFTLQYPVLLASLTPEDDEAMIRRKVAIVGDYLDITLARRLWNSRSIAYSTLQYTMFNVMKDVRGKRPEDLAKCLRQKLDAESETFASNDRLSLHGQNRWVIHQILARMIDHLERSSGLASHYLDYVNFAAPKRNRFEVEHVWADRPERHVAEFPHKADFYESRNRIGGLLLLPKSFNASFGDLEYEKKLEKYFAQNLLAQSLNQKCYDHNPGFLAYLKRSRLPFRACPSFEKADLEERQILLRKLAEEIWNPARLEQALTR